jgi:ADP-ribose pyrophosphatase
MARNIVYRGKKIQVALDESVTPEGVTIHRDVVLHPGAVAILPVVDAEHICLLRNHRFILDQVLWEIPAGTLEPGEAVDAAAVRELAEETGYQAGRWRKLLEFYPSPGVLSERTHLYVAHDLTPGTMRPEADEKLEPEIVPWEKALTWALDGTIRDAKSIIALLSWERLREQEQTGD